MLNGFLAIMRYLNQVRRQAIANYLLLQRDDEY